MMDVPVFNFLSDKCEVLYSKNFMEWHTQLSGAFGRVQLLAIGSIREHDRRASDSTAKTSFNWHR